jgi:hypothetical protein
VPFKIKRHQVEIILAILIVLTLVADVIATHHIYHR